MPSFFVETLHHWNHNTHLHCCPFTYPTNQLNLDPLIQLLHFLLLAYALMGSSMSWDFFISLVFTLLFCSFARSSEDSATQSLNSFVQEYAYRTVLKHRPHTGALYDAMLPQNLSGMDVSVVRLRSRRLWKRGANFSYFRIPPRTITIPYVRRLAIVCQNLGNWSSRYYTLPGYSLVTSVVGFMAFDASNVSDFRIRNLTLTTTGQPISVQFPNNAFMGGVKSKARCVAFSANGTFYLSEMMSQNVCHSREGGHFSIVVPLEKKRRRWYVWMIGSVVGFMVLISVTYYVGVSSMRLLKAKKIRVMERQADEDLVLQSRWVGTSKMPSASVTRTQPVLECNFP